MSGPDITITLPRRKIRSQTGTVHSSANSAATSLSDEDFDDGVQVPPPEGHDYSAEEEDSDDVEEDYDWVPGKHEVGPSESVSRSSISDHHQVAQAPPRRHLSRRESSRIHVAHPPRHHRPPHPSSPESVESHEELYQAYGPDLSRPRPPRGSYYWAPAAGGQSHQYAPSYASQAYSTYSPSSGIQHGSQLVPFNGSSSQYPYSPYQQLPPQSQPGYFPPGQHGMHPSIGMQIGSHGNTPYGGPDMMPPHNAPGYFPYPPHSSYHHPHPAAPSPVSYPHYPSPPAQATPPPAAPPQPAAAPEIALPPEPPLLDPRFEELKQMLLDQRAEQEAKEAAAKKMAEEKAALAEAEKKKAEEIAAAAADAAAKATTAAEKVAAEKAVEEAAKAAEETAKIKAEADAAIAAASAPPPPPEEKKKPIKFKDAVGRKFSFPFHLCATWEGMEELIKQAFMHVDVIGPHVAEGHYDLIGPNNEIILPAVWNTVIEPDWTITMHMWPMPEPKPEEEPPPVEVPVLPDPPPDEGKAGKPKGKKKASKPMLFFGGSSRPKGKNTKPAKKPAPAP